MRPQYDPSRDTLKKVEVVPGYTGTGNRRQISGWFCRYWFRAPLYGADTCVVQAFDVNEKDKAEEMAATISTTSPI